MDSSAPAVRISRQFFDGLYEGAGPEEVGLLTGPAMNWQDRAYSVSRPEDRQRMAEEAVVLGDVRATVATFRAGTRRRAHNVVRARAAMVDLDGDQGEDIGGYLSVLVASGGSTGGRPHHHGVVLLDRPVDRHELEELQRGLRDHLGGDPNFTGSAASLVRIPGTEHRKAGKLRRVELISSDGHRHDPDDLPRSARRTSTPTSVLAPDDLPPDLEEAVQAICGVALGEVRRGASRENVLYDLACTSRRLGSSFDQAVDLLARHYLAAIPRLRGDDYFYRSEFTCTIKGAFELRDGQRRRSGGGGRGRDRRGRCFDPAEIRAWLAAALADESLSVYEREVVKELARRMLGAGSRVVTGGTRSLALAVPCRPRTITNALNGTKKYPGLVGRWIRRARKGVDGAQRWTNRTPEGGGGSKALASPIQASSTASFAVNCVAVYLPPHDAFGFHALGPSIRDSLSVLAGFQHPVSVAQFVASPVVHRSARTIELHFDWLRTFDLASCSDGLWCADLDDLDHKLDVVARDLGTAGLRDRLRRRFALERDLDRKRRTAYGERCREEREREGRERLQRLARRRRRGRMRRALASHPAERLLTSATGTRPDPRQESKPRFSALAHVTSPPPHKRLLQTITSTSGRRTIPRTDREG
jgi:hypothetical protein